MSAYYNEYDPYAAGPRAGRGPEPGNGTADFAWYVWQHDYDGPREICWLRRDA
jgi:hypothetical protein